MSAIDGLGNFEEEKKIERVKEEEGWKGEKEVFLFKSESKKRSPMTSRITSCKQSFQLIRKPIQ